MRSRKTRKLKLKKETLRALNRSEMMTVEGGAMANYYSTHSSCSGSCSGSCVTAHCTRGMVAL